MTAIHFDRVWRVTTFNQSNTSSQEEKTEFEITKLRIQFKIQKNLDSTPNTCELTISNLNENSRTALTRRPLRVRLEAGYDNEPRLLYIGDVGPSPGSRYEGTEWETKLLIGDGLRAFSNARVNKSYRPGTSALTILKDAAASLGLVLPRELTQDKALQAQISTGDISHGFSSDELSRHLAVYGYSWSVQNDQLQILKDEQARPNESPREISEETGMIGSPEIGNPDKKGSPPTITVKTLLYPEIIPGGQVNLISRSVRQGVYKVQQVSHEGDSHGDTWQTTMELIPLGTFKKAKKK